MAVGLPFAAEPVLEKAAVRTTMLLAVAETLVLHQICQPFSNISGMYFKFSRSVDEQCMPWIC